MKQVERAGPSTRVVFLATVRGLVREAQEVAEAARDLEPTCVVLSIGSRELDEIHEVLKERGQMPGAAGNRPAGKETKHGPSGLPVDTKGQDDPGQESDYTDFGLFLSTSDLVFTRHLTRWGDVEAPPPSFQEAVRLAHAGGIEVMAADFDDEQYTDVFLKEVSAFSLVRQGRRLRKLAKRRFKAKSAHEFAIEWDGAVTRIRGYAQVERAREAKVGQGVAGAAARHPRVMAVVELERLEGVVSAFDAAFARQDTPQGAP
jgi:hypothetical protein